MQIDADSTNKYEKAFLLNQIGSNISFRSHFDFFFNSVYMS